MSTLDFYLISISWKPLRSHTFLFCHFAEFRPSTAEISLHHHNPPCHEPKDSHARIRDGRQDGRCPLDVWTEFSVFISDHPVTKQAREGSVICDMLWQVYRTVTPNSVDQNPLLSRDEQFECVGYGNSGMALVNALMMWKGE